MLVWGQTWHLHGYFCLKTGSSSPSARVRSTISVSLSKYCPSWNHSHLRWKGGWPTYCGSLGSTVLQKQGRGVPDKQENCAWKGLVTPLWGALLWGVQS